MSGGIPPGFCGHLLPRGECKTCGEFDAFMKSSFAPYVDTRCASKPFALTELLDEKIAHGKTRQDNADLTRRLAVAVNALQEALLDPCEIPDIDRHNRDIRAALEEIGGVKP